MNVITACNQRLDDPGDYTLAANLECPGTNGIRVNTDNVFIDCMGFNITGDPANPTNIGIRTSPNMSPTSSSKIAVSAEPVAFAIVFFATKLTLTQHLLSVFFAQVFPDSMWELL